jgi:tetratricopeptide (TPR) repeat protein
MAFNKTKALEEAARLVSQRKLSQAIRQYLAIADQDPEDLSLLNTIGDLCVRDGNIPEALRQFYKLAEAYTREGFVLKSIAIYKKIAKLDAHSIDPLLKLAELYTSQGLNHEAREQYAQALAFCQKNSLAHTALQILNKLIAQEPENAAYRMRLAEYYEASGKKQDAFRHYLEAALLAHRHKNYVITEAALKKAAEADPRNPQVLFLQAQLAAEREHWDEAENLLTNTPELQAHREAQWLLLDVYLYRQRMDEAAALAARRYRETPDDFEALDRFAKHCLNEGNPDAALAPLGELIDLILERGHQDRLMELLSRILAAHPRHIPSLDLIDTLCEQAGSTEHSTEVLESLAAIFIESGQWSRAERIGRELLARDASNPAWQALLQQALEQQGKAPIPETPTEEPETSLPSAKPFTPEKEGAESAPAFDTSPSPEPSRVPSATLAPPTSVEIDFSAEWKAFSEARSLEAPEVVSVPPDLGDQKTEIGFYLDYGFFAEAHKAIEALEAKHPNHPQVAELRARLMELDRSQAAVPEPAPSPSAQGEPLPADFFTAQQERQPEDRPPQPELCPAAEDSSAQVPGPQTEPIAVKGSFLEELALGLNDVLDEPRANSNHSHDLHLAGTQGPIALAPLFEDLLKELESDPSADPSQDTPQAHYNLGMAFREMGLLDEAIGEFQKVVKGGGKGNYSPYFLDACSLLGLSFMEKRMPRIAARWFLRAFEAPELDEESTLALTYDLATAYEQAGDLKAALDKFSEVYSVNIDYRDVADKIHALQQKQG